MLTFESSRMTGKTARLLLRTANAMSEGKRILLICQNWNQIRSLQERLQQVLKSVVHVRDVQFDGAGNIVTLLPSGGQTLFITMDTLPALKGMRFDEYGSDPGQLEPHEIMAVESMLRPSDTLDPYLNIWASPTPGAYVDIQHFETEYESKEEPNARRRLSSR